MSRECADCGSTTAPDRRVCKDCSIEDRHGVPSDHFDADAGIVCWVQDLDENWHASMYFEGSQHVAACGKILETPVADVRDDPRRLSGAATCDDCEAALEDDGDDAAVDGGEFEPASELRADGGESMERVTLRIPDSQLEALDDLVEDHYPNRSEAIRDAIRDLTRQYQTVAADGGLEEVFRRETIVATDDGIAIGEDAVTEKPDLEGVDTDV